MIVFSIVWSITLIALILLRNKDLVIDWEQGLRFSIEDKEELADEEREEIKKKA